MDPTNFNLNSNDASFPYLKRNIIKSKNQYKRREYIKTFVNFYNSWSPYAAFRCTVIEPRLKAKFLPIIIRYGAPPSPRLHTHDTPLNKTLTIFTLTCSLQLFIKPTPNSSSLFCSCSRLAMACVFRDILIR